MKARSTYRHILNEAVLARLQLNTRCVSLTMMSIPLPPALAAIVTHLWLKNYAPKSTWIVLGVLLSLPFSLDHQSSSILWSYAIFYATLITTVVVYRVSPFHPLANHPGPLLCKITKFRTVWEAAQGTTHKYYQSLHAKYGPIVRVGPNELSITDKDAIPAILGSQGMHRGPIWDGRRTGTLPGRDYGSLIDIRDKHVHSVRRKQWNQAFTGAAVKDYQQILERTGEELSSLLSKVATTPDATVDIARWVSYFAFDFMGNMAFGGSFNLMTEGDTLGAWKMMEDGLAVPAMTGHVPWIMSLLQKLPAVTAKRDKFKAFGKLHAKKRVQMITKEKDLFHHLYEDTDSAVPVEDKMDLIISDSLLTIVAGSDTTSTVLSAILCCLLSRRSAFSKLREELDDAFEVIDEATGYPKIEFEKLLKLPYLSAVVNEGLRLAPAVPTNIQRAPEAGSGGRLFSDINLWIPEDTAVNIPAYTIHRSPEYFSPSPESFIPERWLSDSSPLGVQYVTTRDAFIPFSHGPANCAGKPLALVELRFIIAILVQRFDMRFKGCPKDAKRETLKEVERKWMDGLKDFFVFSKQPLEVHIAARKFSTKS
ncbi:high nitrogen upregulated cytochrome P450 monooxygenase 2 [Coprinopsis sp. MPI-PUGE-AT-0042]|nr:high nitrogen upregulated cytochrome P450 monooxygenase 2 [Coprinopsis sp. MPI-PUGE-AT-0042]